MIRDALKHGCYELQKARDAWRVAVGPDGMDADLVLHYIEVLFHSFRVLILQAPLLVGVQDQNRLKSFSLSVPEQSLDI